MKKIITICICTILATALLAGCAPKAEAATPEPTPEVTEAATPEATPEPTQEATPEPQPTYVSTYTVVLGEAPEDFVIDERYTAVKFKDTDFTPEGEEITLKEVQAAADPGFVLYWFEDKDGVTQYRAYGEKYEVLTRTDVDGTVTEFVATEPIESGLYPVTIARTDNGLTFTVDPDAQPINADTEKWPVAESATPTKSTGKTEPTPTPKSGSGSGSGNSGSNPTPAPTSGGGSGGGGSNPTPAPAPDPTPAPSSGGGEFEVPIGDPENPQIPIGGW